MNPFFTSLVDRHLDRCDTVQPRTPALFEPDHDGAASPFSGETANPPEADVVPQEDFSPEATVEKNRAPALTRGRENSSPPAPPEREPFSAQDDLHQQQPSRFSRQPQIEPPPHSSMPIEPWVVDQTRPPETGMAGKTPPRETATREDKPPEDRPFQSDTRQPVGENLTPRIQATLQRLAGDLDGRKNGQPDAMQAEQNPTQQNDTSAAELTPAGKPNRDRQEESSGTFPQDSTMHSTLEPPSWLSELETRFKQFAQEKKAQPEPVVNVTIGRVEVRAVQTETPRQKPQPQKPTGVMTLDEYLKQREGGGSR